MAIAFAANRLALGWNALHFGRRAGNGAVPRKSKIFPSSKNLQRAAVLRERISTGHASVTSGTLTAGVSPTDQIMAGIAPWRRSS
jgi:hypothetical protein